MYKTIVVGTDGSHTAAEAVRRAAASEGRLHVVSAYRPGEPADVILDVAEEQGADLVVVGNRGMTGARRFLLGSVPNKVAHHAMCDVLIASTT